MAQEFSLSDVINNALIVGKRYTFRVTDDSSVTGKGSPISPKTVLPRLKGQARTVIYGVPNDYHPSQDELDIILELLSQDPKFQDEDNARELARKSTYWSSYPVYRGDIILCQVTDVMEKRKKGESVLSYYAPICERLGIEGTQYDSTKERLTASYREHTSLTSHRRR